ncbi:MAG: hypothetical protein HY667_07190 [Chloroflexi bacterium]|nr:hypothetical protein [Chloroflexota bacterium]
MTSLEVLRILHIVFGIYVAGSYLFIVPILEPRLKRLGPSIQGPVMNAIMPPLAVVNAISFIMLIGTGVAMTLIMRGGALNTLLTTAWGWVIILGLAATLGAAVVGFGFLIPTGISMDKLGRSIVGRPPSSDESKQLQQLSDRVGALSRGNFVLIVIALAAMIIARYV